MVLLMWRWLGTPVVFVLVLVALKVVLAGSASTASVVYAVPADPTNR
jgi:hypothetical protein